MRFTSTIENHSAFYVFFCWAMSSSPNKLTRAYCLPSLCLRIQIINFITSGGPHPTTCNHQSQPLIHSKLLQFHPPHPQLFTPTAPLPRLPLCFAFHAKSAQISRISFQNLIDFSAPSVTFHWRTLRFSLSLCLFITLTSMPTTTYFKLHHSFSLCSYLHRPKSKKLSRNLSFSDHPSFRKL